MRKQPMETNAEATQATDSQATDGQAPATLAERIAVAREAFDYAKQAVAPTGTAPMLAERRGLLRERYLAEETLAVLLIEENDLYVAEQQAVFDSAAGDVTNLADQADRIAKQLTAAQRARGEASQELTHRKKGNAIKKADLAAIRRQLAQFDAANERSHRPPVGQALVF